MNQQSISQSTENENEGGGLTLIPVKFKNELKRLRDVNGLHATPRTIYLDATGIAKDELINLHLFIPSNRILYTFNVRKLGDAAFSAVGNSEISLRTLLESTKIPEVGFDIRDISRILFHRFKVSLGGVHDDPGKIRWHNPDDAKDLRFYQEFGHAPYWIMKRVKIFPVLWEIYNTKLSKPKNAVWLP